VEVAQRLGEAVVPMNTKTWGSSFTMTDRDLQLFPWRPHSFTWISMTSLATSCIPYTSQRTSNVCASRVLQKSSHAPHFMHMKGTNSLAATFEMKSVGTS
jgi:hypothetical protein